MMHEYGLCITQRGSMQYRRLGNGPLEVSEFVEHRVAFLQSLVQFNELKEARELMNSGLGQRFVRCRYYARRLLRLSPAHVLLQDNGELQPPRSTGNVDLSRARFFRIQEDLSEKPNPSCSASL